MSKSVTLADIASRTGVSTVTVSKALSGKKGVSTGLRERILREADLLGYGKSQGTEPGTIAVVVAERYFMDKQSLYWKIYQEISTNVADKGAFLLLEMVSRSMESEGVLPDVLVQQKADGLLVLGAFEHSYAAKLEQEARVPVAFVDTGSPSGRADSIIADNYYGGYEMTSHLLELGHRNIGYVGTLHVTDSIDDRYFGAQKAMFMRGLSIPDRWVVDDRDRKDFLVTEDGFPLPEGELPTAFFCNCDLSARVLVVQLQKMGYAVPGDISVVGFDHYLSGAQSPVPLTTYDTRIDAMAKKAVHVIRHHIMSPQYTNGITLIRGRFTQGKSAARIGDPVPLI